MWETNLQADFNVRVCDCFDAGLAAALRELDESHRFVQKSAESTSMRPRWSVPKFGGDPPNRRLESTQVVDLETGVATSDRVEEWLATFTDEMKATLASLLANYLAALARAAVCKSNLQPDFNVRVFECFDTSTSAVLRELAKSNRFVQKSAESTSI